MGKHGDHGFVTTLAVLSAGVAPALAAGTIFLAVPSFETLYGDMGVQAIPMATQLVFARWPLITASMLIAVPALGASLRFKKLKNEKAATITVFATGAANLILFALVYWALYGPIWQISAAIK